MPLGREMGEAYLGRAQGRRPVPCRVTLHALAMVPGHLSALGRHPHLVPQFWAGVPLPIGELKVIFEKVHELFVVFLVHARIPEYVLR